eukprot:760047-Hanusia_phi.AAC.1
MLVNADDRMRVRDGIWNYAGGGRETGEEDDAEGASKGEMKDERLLLEVLLFALLLFHSAAPTEVVDCFSQWQPLHLEQAAHLECLCVSYKDAEIDQRGQEEQRRTCLACCFNPVLVVSEGRISVPCVRIPAHGVKLFANILLVLAPAVCISYQSSSFSLASSSLSPPSPPQLCSILLTSVQGKLKPIQLKEVAEATAEELVLVPSPATGEEGGGRRIERERRWGG